MPRNQPRDRRNRPTGLLAFLTIAVAAGVAALGLSVMNAVALSDAASQREDERIAADVEACERSNRLRTQIIDIAEAQRELVVAILELAYSERGISVNPQDTFSSAFDAYEARIDAVEFVDCDQVTPGATSTSLPMEDP